MALFQLYKLRNSNGIICERWTGKDVEGSGHVLF